MPGRYIIPRQSGVHRAACVALYRALLEQCPRIPLPPDIRTKGPINPIKHFIRKRFRENIQHTSPRLIVTALKAGYAAEQLLRSSGDGNASSTSQVHALLRAVHAEAEHSRSVCKQSPPRHRERVWPYPGAPKLVDVRPVPFEKLTGRRHVPHIAVTGSLAFLRIKTPQSPFLSRLLRDKIKLKQKQTDRLEALELQEEIGKREDDWEKVVEKRAERGLYWKGLVLEDSWAKDTHSVKSQTQKSISRGLRDGINNGERMALIWEKEQALAKEETRRRRYIKRQAKAARRLQRKRKGAETPSEDSVH